MPLVARNYRVKNGRGSTSLGGSSYGALIALFAYSKYPDVFGKLLIESPSIYVSKARILDDLKSLKRLPKKIYIGVGTNEEERVGCKPGGDGGEVVTDVMRLKRLLEAAGAKNNSMSIVVEDCAVHNEEAWARRLPAAMVFLFGGK